MNARLRSLLRLVSLAIVVGAVVTSGGTAQAEPSRPGLDAVPAPKNVIVMISDGCGYNHVDATSYYQYGKTGMQVYESFPVKIGLSTFSYNTLAGSFFAGLVNALSTQQRSFSYNTVTGYDPTQAWSDFGYVRVFPTDSASAGTAMSTGKKVWDNTVGVDTDRTTPLYHVFQQAEKRGKATGVVTSVELSHATPAGYVAHNISRNNYAQIANEMIKSSATDVIMGTGHPRYDDSGVPATMTYNYVGGQATWDGLLDGSLPVADANGDGMADPWTLIQDRGAFEALATGAAPKRVLGVPQVHTTLQQARGGVASAAPFAVPMNAGVPTLETMTKGALNVLDDNRQGFYLMIEGGAVDWAGHANQTGRLIEEEIDFNKAVEAVVAWVEATSNWTETLLIVTGDHETGYLVGPGSGPGPFGSVWTALVNNGAGRVPGVQWMSTDHTNSLIPFYAKGAAAAYFTAMADQEDPVRGRYIDNTEIAEAMFHFVN